MIINERSHCDSSKRRQYLFKWESEWQFWIANSKLNFCYCLFRNQHKRGSFCLCLYKGGKIIVCERPVSVCVVCHPLSITPPPTLKFQSLLALLPLFQFDKIKTLRVSILTRKWFYTRLYFSCSKRHFRKCRKFFI